MPPSGGGGHSGMQVWLTCAAPPWGVVAVGGAVRVKKGGGDLPTISKVGDSLDCQGDLIGKFSIVFSGLW